jgi:hypothetical protein
MSQTEDANDKVTPGGNRISSMSPATLLAVLIMIVQVLVSILKAPRAKAAGVLGGASTLPISLG